VPSSKPIAVMPTLAEARSIFHICRSG